MKFDTKENIFPTTENERQDTAPEVRTLPFSLALSEPLVFGETTYRELTFKHPLRYKHLAHMPTSEKEIKMGHFIPLIAGMTGLMSVEIEELASADFMKCIEALTPFMQASGTASKP